MIVSIFLTSERGNEYEYVVEALYHPESKGSNLQPPESEDYEVVAVWREGHDVTHWIKGSVHLLMQVEDAVRSLRER